jgi:hypothetical protein
MYRHHKYQVTCPAHTEGLGRHNKTTANHHEQKVQQQQQSPHRTAAVRRCRLRSCHASPAAKVSYMPAALALQNV